MAQLSIHGLTKVARDEVHPRAGLTHRLVERVKTAVAWIDGRPVDYPLAEVELESGETVLAASSADESCDPVLLTDRALYYRSTQTQISRIGWEYVWQVNADAGSGILSLACLSPQTPGRVILRQGSSSQVEALLAVAGIGSRRPFWSAHGCACVAACRPRCWPGGARGLAKLGVPNSRSCCPSLIMPMTPSSLLPMSWV